MSGRLPLLFVLALLAGCGQEDDAPPASPPAAGAAAAVDSTRPVAVAEAWVRAWCAGGESHRAYEFDTAPGPWGNTTVDYREIPRGTAVAEVRARSTQGANYPADPDPSPPFGLDAFSLRQPLGKTTVSSPAMDFLTCLVEARLADGGTRTWTILLRPEGSLEKRVVADGTTRWRVYRTRN